MDPIPDTAEASRTSTTRLQSHSCVLCQRRKVRCDKNSPCSRCEKAGIECVYNPVLHRGRPKRKSPQSVLVSRLRYYEERLRNLGETIEPLHFHITTSQTEKTAENDGQYESDQPEIHEANVRRSRGKIITEGERSRYLDNNLWVTVGEELSDTADLLKDASSAKKLNPGASLIPDEGELILGDIAHGSNLTALHPKPAMMMKLWQIFLNNIQPLTKIVHSPTTQQQIIGSSDNLANVSKSLEALMFAIYSCAVYSLSETDCESQLGESKSVLLASFQAGTCRSLINACFLRSTDLVVLQALLLFLLSAHNTHDCRTIFALSGIAVRTGQIMGLHCDGMALGLPPFYVQMRRRIWWLIMTLDSKAGLFAGVDAMSSNISWDTQRPLNLNDCDLFPQMRDTPTEHEGVTEMMLCQIRYYVGDFVRNKVRRLAKLSTEDRERAIEELEQFLNKKFIQYCDPVVPMHFHAMLMTESVVAAARVSVHRQAQRLHRDAKLSDFQKDVLFWSSLKVMENENIAQTSEILKGFRWHFDAYFQYQSLISLLNELRTRTDELELTRAWDCLSQVFTNNPHLCDDTTLQSSLHAAIGSLTLKAWEVREKARRNSEKTSSIPKFVSELRLRLRRSSRAQNVPTSSHDSLQPLPANNADLTGVDDIPKSPTSATLEHEVDQLSNSWLSYSPYSFVIDQNLITWDSLEEMI
ncbi:hypothetical protein V1511DRAFT_463815 [Dipodascopsis uninucleata]